MKFIKYSEIRRTTYNSKTEIITRKINKLLFFKVNQDEIFKTRLPMLSFFEGIPLNYIQSIRVHNIGNIYIEEFFDWESYYNNTAYEKPTWTLPTSEFSWRSDINSFMNELRSIIFDGKRYINPYTKTVYALLKLKGRIKWLNNKSKGSLWDQTVATAYRNVIHRKDFNDTVFLLKEYKCFLYPPFINFQRKKTELTNIVNSFNVRNNF